MKLTYNEFFLCVRIYNVFDEVNFKKINCVSVNDLGKRVENSLTASGVVRALINRLCAEGIIIVDLNKLSLDERKMKVLIEDFRYFEDVKDFITNQAIIHLE